MVEKLSGRMLALMRQSRGLTQTELGKAAGMSQAVVSKLESGALEDDGHRLAALALALACPPDRLLIRTNSEVQAPCVVHRKRSSLPNSAQARLRAELELALLEMRALLPAIQSPPHLAPADDGYVSPSDIARQIRTQASQPRGPITDVVAVAESLGIVVLEWDIPSAKIDAIAAVRAEGLSIVLLRRDAPADRRRFTLAHEVGHVVMHDEHTGSQEAEADEFASELLMPARDIRSQLVGLTLPRLLELKRQWGVSMAALIRRARDLGELDDPDYRALMIRLSSAGYRTEEPGDLALEHPTLLPRALRAHRAAGLTDEDLARRATLSIHEFAQRYGALT